MASVWGALGQSNPLATTLTDAYTVPALKHAAAQIIACNRSGAAITLRISHAINGAADTAAQYLVYDYSLAANQTYVTSKIALKAGDIIRIYSSVATTAFQVNGVEDDD